MSGAVGMRLQAVFVIAVAAALALPSIASAQSGAATRAYQAKSKRPKIVVRPGYGFLPGYRPQLPNSIPAPYGYGYHFSGPRYPHYWDWWGRSYYGYGRPGFYRGRWNGGGIGPCYTQTPIGPIWNCGR